MTVSELQPAFTRCWHNLKTVEFVAITKSLQSPQRRGVLRRRDVSMTKDLISVTSKASNEFSH